MRIVDTFQPGRDIPAAAMRSRICGYMCAKGRRMIREKRKLLRPVSILRQRRGPLYLALGCGKKNKGQDADQYADRALPCNFFFEK